MIPVLWLMLLQGALGAFDTVYYHELRAKLPAGGARTRTELVLHAARDFVYALLFATLPFVAWQGRWTAALLLLLSTEVVITLTDFAVEVRTRAPAGVLPGERVTHGVMAIVYGAMLALLAPLLADWSGRPDGFASVRYDVHAALRLALAAMAAGVFASGVRDLYAALGLPGGAFPWRSA